MKPIRDALVELGQSLDRMATSSMNLAKENALDALDGDTKAEIKAHAAKARSAAYTLAMEKVDDLRREVEAGNIG